MVAGKQQPRLEKVRKPYPISQVVSQAQEGLLLRRQQHLQLVS